jgi:hypothetical protein
LQGKKVFSNHIYNHHGSWWEIFNEINSFWVQSALHLVLFCGQKFSKKASAWCYYGIVQKWVSSVFIVTRPVIYGSCLIQLWPSPVKYQGICCFRCY